MSDVANAVEAKRSKRETGDADSDSYEEYKSDEDGGGGVGGAEEELTFKDEVKIISVHTDDKVVDGITVNDATSTKEIGDVKKDKKKKEKRSKHGSENVDGQESKERKKEKKSREGKKEKRSKENTDKVKTNDVKTKTVEEERKEIAIAVVSPAEQPKSVEEPHEKAGESKPAEVTAAATVPEAAHENPPSVAPVPEKAEKKSAPEAPTEADPIKQKEEEKAEHLVVSTEVTPTVAPLTETKEEKTVESVVVTEVTPHSEPHVSEKKEDVIPPDATPSKAAASESTLSEAASVPEDELVSESQPIAASASQPPVADSNPPEPSPPSTDAVAAETGEPHLPRKSDASDQESASASGKREAAHAPTGVQKILEHARVEAEARATGSTRLLMARSLVSRQEKLQEQLTNMRHQFGDIDSEIRALKIDCYRNQRTFPKHH